jgi:hypothetical protein
MDFNAKLGRVDTFKPITGRKSVHIIGGGGGGGGVTVINTAMSKVYLSSITMCLHCNSHKPIWPSDERHRLIIS